MSKRKDEPSGCGCFVIILLLLGSSGSWSAAQVFWLFVLFCLLES